MVVNPVYKGIQQYGRRSTRPQGRDIITASILPLVSEEIWQAAQDTLRRNRAVGPATGRVYLLKSVIRCGHCGLTYVSCLNRGSVWYRCNGHLTGRGPTEGRCTGKDIKGDYLEPHVWNDIETFLRDPGDLINELAQEKEGDSSAVIRATERITFEGALHQVLQRRKNAIDLRTRDRITDGELDDLLAEVDKEKSKIEERLLALNPEVEEEQTEQINEDLLTEIRKRLDSGITPEKRQEVVRLLVKKITICTEGEGTNRKARATIEYRFPTSVAVPTGTGTDSSPPPA
jgi:site-specific DNA recombinase